MDVCGPLATGRVIGLFKSGWVRVELQGTGLFDGGESDWPLAWLPEAVRRPKGEFLVVSFEGGEPLVLATATSPER